MNQTIFALATAPGRAAVAVMRISGDGAKTALAALGAGPPPPRRASLRRLRGQDGAVLDEALVLWMPGPKSFTGEDCAELHLHGGAAVVSAVGDRLLGLGLRLAGPGEFTRRAFEAGRIDLIQAEAVADLVDAETEAQRLQATRQLSGATSRGHEAWRGRLTHILAGLEAAIDFPDEEIPSDVLAHTIGEITTLADELEAAAADKRGERIRDGFRVALLGAPNVGKSSLFNALLGREAAIVTDVPGTTRDVIEAELVLAGRRVVLADLAGLRESDDVVEREGVRRALAWAETADLRIHLTQELLSEPEGVADLRLLSKADCFERAEGTGRRVSARTGEGLGDLRLEIERRVIAATTGADAPAATRERHRFEMLEAAARLQASQYAREPELIAEEVRLAARALARLAGQVQAEDVLGAIFSSFCIGK